MELARFRRPDHEPGSPAAMANELGLRSLQEVIHRPLAEPVDGPVRQRM